MGKKIGRKLVVVPHKSVPEVVANVLEVHLGEVFFHDEMVEAVHQDVDARHLKGGHPVVGFPVPGSQKGVGAL